MKYGAFCAARRYLLAGLGALLAACATQSPQPVAVDMAASRAQQAQAQKQAELPAAKVLKRKIAIGRFSNETRYGRTFQTDASSDPLGKQASDMLAARLVGSNRFLVFERQDLSKLKEEQRLLKDGNLVGVDALVLGSVTEFGRSTTGAVGFMSSTKVQTARAKVEIRLADARTGLVFFSATGTGEATTEAGEIAGYGSRANYDSTLNDRAIGAAISDVLSTLMTKLEERVWRTDVLKAEGRTVYISGGSRQGLKPGDMLSVIQEGEKVTSGQTGMPIVLPGRRIATLRVISFFGTDEATEGAVCEVVSGDVKAGANIYVGEAGA
jgi:curli biogenesis system outer membrane secretion channel CsgG